MRNTGREKMRFFAFSCRFCVAFAERYLSCLLMCAPCQSVAHTLALLLLEVCVDRGKTEDR